MIETKIRLPNGEIRRIRLPEGMSKEQLNKELSKYLQGTTPEAAPKLPHEMTFKEAEKAFPQFNTADLQEYSRQVSGATSPSAEEVLAPPRKRGVLPKGDQIGRGFKKVKSSTDRDGVFVVVSDQTIAG